MWIQTIVSLWIIKVAFLKEFSGFAVIEQRKIPQYSHRMFLSSLCEPLCINAPSKNRTCNLWIRSPTKQIYLNCYQLLPNIIYSIIS